MQEKSDMKHEIQLFCIGYAGSDATAFHILHEYLPESVLVSAVEYAGRGSRHKEAFYASNEEMENDVANQIREMRNPELPYAILGYSMGAQVVYEIFAKHLIEEQPVCIFLAAHEPPDVACKGKAINMDNDEEFFEQMKYYGGIDERLLKDKRFYAIFGARIKADFQLLQEYCFSGRYEKLPSKVVVMYCESDTPFSDMLGWSRFAKQEIEFHEMGENHFFYKTEIEKFCRIIEENL